MKLLKLLVSGGALSTLAMILLVSSLVLAAGPRVILVGASWSDPLVARMRDELGVLGFEVEIVVGSAATGSRRRFGARNRRVVAVDGRRPHDAARGGSARGGRIGGGRMGGRGGGDSSRAARLTRMLSRARQRRGPLSAPFRARDHGRSTGQLTPCTHTGKAGIAPG